MITTPGIHHVTAIASDAQQNVDFYAGTLGLRLVKRTVNFDDPHTYHLYYGDDEGSPGSILTFFPWPGAARGRAGVGQVAVISLAVPPASLGYWLQRFVAHGVDHEPPARRFGEPMLRFRDRDGMQLELVATTGIAGRRAWTSGGISAAHAVHGVHSVTLWEHSLDGTQQILVEGLGFRRLAEEEFTTRFVSGDEGAGTIVDVRVVGGFLGAIQGAGTVHHVAVRAQDDSAELALREQVSALGMRPTPVIDRQYFHSVYFRERGGVLFELATDNPGFATDESVESLGIALQLPPQYETRRVELERTLPALHPPLQVPLAEAPADAEGAS